MLYLPRVVRYCRVPINKNEGIDIDVYTFFFILFHLVHPPGLTGFFMMLPANAFDAYYACSQPVNYDPKICVHPTQDCDPDWTTIVTTQNANAITWCQDPGQTAHGLFVKSDLVVEYNHCVEEPPVRPCDGSDYLGTALTDDVILGEHTEIYPGYTQMSNEMVSDQLIRTILSGMYATYGRFGHRQHTTQRCSICTTEGWLVYTADVAGQSFKVMRRLNKI